MVDVDSETLFNVAAAAVATIAVVHFVLNVDVGYSPVTKYGLAVAFLAAVFYVTQLTRDDQLTLLGYGVLVVSGVALFLDAVNTFRVDDALTVVGLLVIAGVLFALRAGLDERSHFVSESAARYALVAVCVLVAGVLVVDVVTGGLAYELQPRGEVTYGTDDGEPVVASVTVTNPTPLPERVDVPQYDVCTAGNWSTYRAETRPEEPAREVRAHVNVNDGYNEHVFGFGSKTYSMHLYLNGVDARGETFPVRVTDGCPDDEAGAPFVALFEASEDRSGVRAV